MVDTIKEWYLETSSEFKGRGNHKVEYLLIVV
jgi:hypothetical protein